MTFATIAVASLRHRATRVVFSAFALAISLGTIAFTASVTQRVKATLDASDLPRLGVISTLRDVYPVADLRKIGDALGVSTGIEYVQIFGGSDGKRYGFMVWSASEGYAQTYPKVLVDVDRSDEARWLADRQGAVVTESVLKAMGWKVGDSPIVKTSLGDVPMHIVGVIHGIVEPSLIAHYAYLDALQPVEDRGRVFNATVPCPKVEFDSASKRIEQMFESYEQPLISVPWRALAAYYTSDAVALPRMLEWVGIVMALVAILIHAVALTTSLAERRAEIATLRILGFSRPRLAMLIVLESLGTCVLGGVIGCLIPYLLLNGRALELGIFGLSDVTLSPVAVAIGLAIAVAAGLVASVVPIIQIYRTDLLASMRDD